jgi:hypothetical protein
MENNEDSTVQNTPVVIIPGPTQTIYQDRFLELGFGAQVSKIILGLEVGENTFSPSITLIMPTINFIDGIEFLYQMVKENPDLKNKVLPAIDLIKERINKL